MADGFQPLTVAQIQTPDGIAQLNNIIQTLYNNMAGDGVNVSTFYGVGSPEGVVTAGIGSIYLRTDGGTNTSLYRKESGIANTGWVATSNITVPISTANGGLGADFSGGTSGKFLYFSSTGVIGQISAPVWVPTNIQVFTSSGTWTKPAGVSSVYVKAWGAGGGGGGAGGSGAGGGGGGGYSEGYVVVSGNVTVTVGTGGVGDNAGAGPTDGGASSFAASGGTIQGSGGKAGATAGGAGGTASGGQINLSGQPGDPRNVGTSTSGGRGGSSPFGGSGGYGNFSSGGGGNGAGIGDGGGGSVGGTGGAGANGYIIVYY